jgi:biotin carboxyl carrier protein
MKIRVNIDGDSFDVEVGNLYERPVMATVDGTQFEVWPEGKAPYLPKPPIPKGGLPRIRKPNENYGLDSNAVTAPIPGLIQSVKITEGEFILNGQEICVLEAMKMKNVIRSPRPGRIAAVNISKGQQVAQGEVLVVYVDSH